MKKSHVFTTVVIVLALGAVSVWAAYKVANSIAGSGGLSAGLSGFFVSPGMQNAQPADILPRGIEIADVAINTGAPVTPEEFIKESFYKSKYTIRFAKGKEPDVFLAGTQRVGVVLEDNEGYRYTLTAELTVRPNESPPVFSGLRDLEVMLGGVVMYRRGVTAEDSFGNPLVFNVDSGGVDVNIPGVYAAEYSAADANGNKTTETVSVKVINVSEEALAGLINAVLDTVVDGGMTRREAAKSIFDWVCQNIRYAGTPPIETVFEGAYRGLQTRQGDCYTYYAVSAMLLQYAGIESVQVSRVPSTQGHHWNLVNIEGEGWYHFDTTPNRVSGLDLFLFTDTEAARYTETILAANGTRDYYTYYKELYPEVVQ